MRRSYRAEFRQYVRGMHPDESGHHRGNPKTESALLLQILRQISPAPKFMDSCKIGVKRIVIHLPEEAQKRTVQGYLLLMPRLYKE